MKEELIYFACGFCGMTIQFLQGLQTLKKQSAAANFQFVFKKYLADDIVVLVSTIVTIFLFILILPNIVTIKPDSIKIARIMFGFVGWTGSAVLQLIFSPTEQKIRNIIDVKTNIADKNENPTQ